MHKWRERKQEVEKKYGKWLSYDIGFSSNGFYLKNSDSRKISHGASIAYFEKIVSYAEDFLKKPLSKSTVLDLGCGEGIASFAFAGHGAKKIVGIEGRKASIAKAHFTKKLLGIKNTDFRNADVRKLKFTSKSFDIVLALGILYHLDTPGLFDFVKNLVNWTSRITVIDTHIALLPKIKHKFEGKDYFGLNLEETVPYETNDGSIGNKKSFWLTRASLYKLLTHVGYTSIYSCIHPRTEEWRGFDDRLIIIATRESRQESIKPDQYKEHDPNMIFINEPNLSALREFYTSNPIKKHI